MRRDVFQAIADPVRREIIEIISENPHSTNQILENFSMSKQAIAKQLNILKECNIVSTYKVGKERFYAINTTSLIPAYLWIEKLQSQWEERIDSFEAYLKQLKLKNNDE